MRAYFSLMVLSLAAWIAACSPDSASPPSDIQASAATETDPVIEASEATVEDEYEVAAEIKPIMDPEALEATQSMIDFLEGLKSFSLAAERALDVVQDNGQKLQFSARFTVDVRRPDRLHVKRQQDDGSGATMWYDGKSLAIQPDQSSYYGRVDAPATIDETLDFLETRLETPMPMVDLVYNDLTPLMEAIISTEYIGDAVLGDTPVRHIAYRGESVDWQLWIQSEGDPLPRKLVITYRDREGMPQISAFFHHWKANPELADSVFEFEPPAGAEQIRIVARGAESEQTGSE